MVDVQRIKRGIANPRLVVDELVWGMNRRYYRNPEGYNSEGIDIFEEDWDNLIILDACRFDEFAKRSSLPGRLESRTSRGATSSEFIRGNFTEKQVHDVVYISANGWYAKLEDELNASINQFTFVERDEIDQRTSHPKTVANKALKVAKQKQDKRIMVHFMQPHQPYLGQTGRQMPYYGGLRPTARSENVTHEDIIQAYRENLDLALSETMRLLEEFDGRTVVTADHGELLGERQRPIPIKWYGHPGGVYVNELVNVPWHIYDEGSRRNIVAERSEEDTDDEEFLEVEQHLRDLGYRT